MQKDSTLTARVDSALRASVDAVLGPDESMSQFIEAIVRSEVEYRQMKAAFYAEAIESMEAVDAGEPTLTLEEVNARLDAKIEAARKELIG